MKRNDAHAQACATPCCVAQAAGPAEQKWLAFFQDPNAYYDNRSSKRNPRCDSVARVAGPSASVCGVVLMLDRAGALLLGHAPSQAVSSQSWRQRPTKPLPATTGRRTSRPRTAMLRCGWTAATRRPGCSRSWPRPAS